MSHDFEAQRADTIWVWNDLVEKHGEMQPAVLDLQFVPDGMNADLEAFERELTSLGYRCAQYSDDVERQSRPLSVLSSSAPTRYGSTSSLPPNWL